MGRRQGWLSRSRQANLLPQLKTLMIGLLGAGEIHGVMVSQSQFHLNPGRLFQVALFPQIVQGLLIAFNRFLMGI